MANDRNASAWGRNLSTSIDAIVNGYEHASYTSEPILQRRERLASSTPSKVPSYYTQQRRPLTDPPSAYGDGTGRPKRRGLPNVVSSSEPLPRTRLPRTQESRSNSARETFGLGFDHIRKAATKYLQENFEALRQHPGQYMEFVESLALHKELTRRRNGFLNPGLHQLSNIADRLEAFKWLYNPTELPSNIDSPRELYLLIYHQVSWIILHREGSHKLPTEPKVPRARSRSPSGPPGRKWHQRCASRIFGVRHVEHTPPSIGHPDDRIIYRHPDPARRLD